ncbi:G5 domain-containing protein, partial [Streptococcus sp. E29BA]
MNVQKIQLWKKGKEETDQEGVNGSRVDVYEDIYVNDVLETKGTNPVRSEDEIPAQSKKVRVGTKEIVLPVVNDEHTGVKVTVLSNQDNTVAAQIESISITHMETGNTETPSVLREKDYDLFDIELVDTDGNIVKPTAPVDVYLPI